MRTIYIFQNRKSKDWIAGIQKDGSYEFSPKIQDAMIFYGRFLADSVPISEYRCETIVIREFKPPRPRRWKPVKKKSAPKKSLTSAEATVTAVKGAGQSKHKTAGKKSGGKTPVNIGVVETAVSMPVEA